MCNFHYAAMYIMTSQILRFVSFTKLQKPLYLEKGTLFALQIKKITNHTSRATLWQKRLGSGGNL